MNHLLRKTNLLFPVICAAMYFHSGTVRSEIIAEDNLSYPSGKLADETGGTGWSAPWHAFGFTTSTSGATTTSLGGQGTNEAFRKFATPVPFGDPVYFSTVVDLSDLNAQFYAALNIYQMQNSKPEEMVSIGIMNGFAFAQGPSLPPEQGKSFEAGHSGTVTLVGRLRFETNGDATLTLWMNPQNEDDTAASQSFEKLGFSGQYPFGLAKLHFINKGASGAATFRDIKVSSTWPLTN